MQRHTFCLAIGPLRFLLRRHGNFGSSLQSCFVTPDGFVPKFFNLGCAFFHLSISMRLHARLQFPRYEAAELSAYVFATRRNARAVLHFQ